MGEIIHITTFPKGEITVPPSKSVAHRSLICAAIAGGGTQVQNLQLSEDIKATLRCISALGGEYSYQDNVLKMCKEITIQRQSVVLDCGESGSTLRFFIPIVAALGADATFVGAKRLFERPVKPYIETFANKNINIETFDSCIKINGKLTSGEYYLQGNVSSQFVTGLVFGLSLCKGESQIVMQTPLESKGYVDLTIGELEAFGVQIKNHDYKKFVVPANCIFATTNRIVEGDYSGGAFMLCSAALGCDITVKGLSQTSKQGDKNIINILKMAGADVVFDNKDNIKVVVANGLHAFSIDVGEIPDLVPPIAVLMGFCKGESKITNAARLRIKESDRLKTVTSELSRLGVDITEHTDSLTICGKPSIAGGECDGNNDHRIAMMCAVAAIKSSSIVSIKGYKCVEKSYPSFFNDFCTSSVAGGASNG